MNRCRRSLLSWLPVFLVISAAAAQEYEVGGPLAGVRLEPFPTQHGEQPGYPGCIPQRIEGGAAVEDMGQEYRQWGPQGQTPQWQLYDGSIEHWRAYMFKYLPIRSFFDRQSQLKNFVAPALPGADSAQAETYAEPLYWVPRHEDPRPTGLTSAPVPVLRMRAGGPLLRLDLGELDAGLYAIRVIGAVETPRLRPFREPLYLRMTVNDRLDGGRSNYRLRAGYCDQFYSVVEFYFHGLQRRSYQAELAVDAGSTVDLLVHNVSLDDALAGTQQQPIKTRTTLARQPVANAGATVSTPAGPARGEARTAADAMDRARRLKRDAEIWQGFPPLNAQGSELRVGAGGYGSIAGVRAGSAELTGEQIESRFGAWVPPEKAGEMRQQAGWSDARVLLANPHLKLIYTLDDLAAGRPLPDPYPLKDDGAGLYFPDPHDPQTGAAWTPVASRVHELFREYYSRVGRSLAIYRQRGNPDDAHDAALALVRYAFAFPSLDYSEYLSNAVHDPGPFGRDASCRRRFTDAGFLPHYPMYVQPIMFQYDELFDFIRGSQALAESVGRFVPWVKSPQDVTRLIDVYLVQTVAKRIMRYHYHTDVVDLANLAAVVGNRQATDPWLEWLFSRTFIYPLPVAGVQDVMISGCTREGTEVVGSAYYAQGEGAARVAESLGLYLQAGGNPHYDLSDPQRYPKPAAHAWWRLDNVVAGADFLRIGDVCGPDKAPGHTLRDLAFARPGWRWTGDPAFAFVLKHYLGRADENDAEWSRIEASAARQQRAPWLQRRSRVMPMWAGVLETGLEHDDYRFRRAAYLRLGYGTGHHHYDSLDLQIVAHGLPMAVDAGQRPGYSVPGDRTTRLHNVVQVDDHPAYRHSWATALADVEGARYLAAQCDPPPGVALFRRQIALIDASGGSGSQALSATDQLPGAKLPGGVTTPNSYVFDVVRVHGGSRHTYNFHGPLNDDFQWNATAAGPPAPGTDEAEYLSRFSLMPELNSAGDAPPTLQAVWRMASEVDGTGRGDREMLGINARPPESRSFTRLHLLGTGGGRALRGELVCKQWGYHFTNLSVAMPHEPAASRAFAAVIEPYVDEPFVRDLREVAVEPPGDGAHRAVAVEVATADGRTDICFADGQAHETRRIPQAQLNVSGEFAFYSLDSQGLRQAVLVGGSQLSSPVLRIETAAAERRAAVSRVDYLNRKLWIQPAWPARRGQAVLELGVPGHWTTYTSTAVEDDGQESCVSLLRGGDYFRSRIEHVDAENSIVTATLRPLIDAIDHNRSGWVASDDEARTFWRATYLGAGRFRLDGPPISEAAFGPDKIMRLWEYGEGDNVRQSTTVSLQRSGDAWHLTADVAVTVSLPGQSIEMSDDGRVWRSGDTQAADGWTSIRVEARDDPLWIRAPKQGE